MRYIAGLQCSPRFWLLVNEPPHYELPALGSPLDLEREIGSSDKLAMVEVRQALTALVQQ